MSETAQFAELAARQLKLIHLSLQGSERYHIIFFKIPLKSQYFLKSLIFQIFYILVCNKYVKSRTVGHMCKYVDSSLLIL